MKLGIDLRPRRPTWILVLIASSFASCTCQSEEMSACMAECDKISDRKSQCAGPDAKICKKDVGRMVDECEANCKALHGAGSDEGEADGDAKEGE